MRDPNLSNPLRRRTDGSSFRSPHRSEPTSRFRFDVLLFRVEHRDGLFRDSVSTAASFRRSRRHAPLPRPLLKHFALSGIMLPRETSLLVEANPSTNPFQDSHVPLSRPVLARAPSFEVVLPSNPMRTTFEVRTENAAFPFEKLRRTNPSRSSSSSDPLRDRSCSSLPCSPCFTDPLRDRYNPRRIETRAETRTPFEARAANTDFSRSLCDDIGTPFEVDVASRIPCGTRAASQALSWCSHEKRSSLAGISSSFERPSRPAPRSAFPLRGLLSTHEPRPSDDRLVAFSV